MSYEPVAPMVLNTERLLLRPFRRDDLDLMRRIYCDEQVLRYTPFDTLTPSQAEARLETFIGGWGLPPEYDHELAVVLKGTGERIGRAHIEVDPEADTGMIGWFLIPGHWGRGYATEMTRVLIDCCFDSFRLHRVNAVCHPDNGASRRVLEKYGMRLEAYFRKKIRYVKGGTARWEDELQYALLASERDSAGVRPAERARSEP